MGKKKSDTELTALEECCCQHYVANGGDQSKALRECHKSAHKWKNQTVWVNASKLFSQNKVQLRIKELQAETAEKLLVSDESVLREHARIGFSDIRRIFDEDGLLKKVHELDDDTAAAVSSVKVVTKNIGDGEVEYIHEYKMWPKNPALEALSKHLGLFEKDNDQKKDNSSVTVINAHLAEMVQAVKDQIRADAEQTAEEK